MRRCRVSFLLLPPCALLAACSGTQVDRQAAAASTVADAWNDVARPAIVRTYENDQRAAVDALCPAERTDCPRPPLVAAVAAVRARWQPVWDLSEAARAAHDAWRGELETCRRAPRDGADCVPDVARLAAAFVERADAWRCALHAIGHPELDTLPGRPACGASATARDGGDDAR